MFPDEIHRYSTVNLHEIVTLEMVENHKFFQTGPDGERIRFGCTPYPLQNVPNVEDFELIDWYQHPHLAMVERFNTSGILGAKFCGTSLCNLPDSNMNTELKIPTEQTTSSFTTTTQVVWIGYPWPEIKQRGLWEFAPAEISDTDKSTKEQKNGGICLLSNTVFSMLTLFHISSLF